jgi:multiple sugar transport system ATP-binding protein
LSNLDAKLRVEMRTEIKQLHQRIQTTIVYVTHDQIEAMTLADRIAIMKEGILQQFDSPHQVYENPANQFVAGFMGSPSMNFISSRVVKQNGTLGLLLQAGRAEPFFVTVPESIKSLEQWLDKQVVLGIRPEHMTDRLFGRDKSPQVQAVQCRAQVLEPTGPDTLLFTTINEQEVTCRINPDTIRKPGESVTLMLDMSKALFFVPETGERIR